MIKVTLRSLTQRKLRFALTTFAVVLGVAFVSGSFVLADSLRKAFDDLASDIGESVNVQVRGAQALEGDNNSRPPVPPEIVELVEGVDGVTSTVGVIQGQLNLSYERDDVPTSIGGGGPPVFGFNYVEGDGSTFELLTGAPPGPGEIVLDAPTVRDLEFDLGQVINVRALAPPADYELVGVVTFAGQEEDNNLGQVLALFDEDTTRMLFGLEAGFHTVDVVGPSDETPEQLAERLQRSLPAGFEAVAGDVIAEEFSEEFDTIIDVFQYALLAFAAVALVVSAFIINNTFAIVLGQRIRELGLLRCLGATGAQIRRSVLGESVLIGLVASVVGAVAGLGVAWLITWIIEQAFDGGGLPLAGVSIAPRTWLVSLIVGVGVTTLAAYAPARRAATIPPVAALSEGVALQTRSSTRRNTIGIVFGIVGAALLAVGVLTDISTVRRLIALAGGSLALFVGVALLSPLVARRVATILGAPVSRIGKIPGTIARNNAGRNPQRTSATASALMVGLALVVMVLIVGTSFKKTFVDALGSSLNADYYVSLSAGGGPGVGFSPQLVSELNALDEVELAVGMRGGVGARALVEGEARDILGVPEAAFAEMLNADITDGTYEGLDAGGIMVHIDNATDDNISVGDVLNATFPLGERSLPVVAIFEDATIVGNWVIGLPTYAEAFDPAVQFDVFAAVLVADGQEVDTARATLDAVALNYPEVNLQDTAEFQQTSEEQIDQLLAVVNALLVFAIVIAALGVINTQMLSVFERTREIGLLRAVGMTRRQTRRMIRWEGVIVTTFGGLLGVALGVVFGLIALAAMPPSFISGVAIPYGQLVMVLVLSVVVGVVAAILPARRAARMNVLAAISHD